MNAAQEPDDDLPMMPPRIVRTETYVRKDAYDALLAERDALKIENDEADTLNTRLGDILTLVANALKGEPDSRCLHDWSDLPRVAAALKEKAERGRVALSNLVARFGIAQPHMGGAYRWGGFVPGTNAGRTMEQDDTEARICSAPDFLTTSATESRGAKGGTE